MGDQPSHYVLAYTWCSRVLTKACEDGLVTNEIAAMLMVRRRPAFLHVTSVVSLDNVYHRRLQSNMLQIRTHPSDSR